MPARCSRMIAPPVKRLGRHGLLRKPVYTTMGFHGIRRYDKNPNMEFMGYSKHRNGTRLFNAPAGVHCMEGARARPGVPVRARETFPADAAAAPLYACKGSGTGGAHAPAGPRVLLDRHDRPAGGRGITWPVPAKTDAVK